jgi:hypothetical protein
MSSCFRMGVCLFTIAHAQEGEGPKAYSRIEFKYEECCFDILIYLSLGQLCSICLFISIPHHLSSSSASSRACARKCTHTHSHTHEDTHTCTQSHTHTHHPALTIRPHPLPLRVCAQGSAYLPSRRHKTPEQNLGCL